MLTTMQVSTISDMKNYEIVFINLHTSFITSCAIYRQSCEQLLSPLMLPDNQFRELLGNDARKAWQDPEIGKSLRKRLGCDHPEYESCVKMLDEMLVQFGKKLGLGKDIRVRI
jgi:hypothetical protein